MKRKLFICFTVLSLTMFLSACTSSDVNKTSNDGSEAKTVSKKEEDDREEEVKNGPLTEIGQWAKESDGTKVTLKKIATLEETLDLDPIKLTLHDVKLLERIGGENDGNVIQVGYTVENISDKEIMFDAIEIITTNTKKQIDVILENMSGIASGQGEYYGEVKEEGFIIVPYPGDSFDELTSIRLITGDVWDNNQPDKFHESVTKEVVFEE